MSDPLRVRAGEADVDALVDALQAGRRIVVTVEVLGSEQDVTLRYDGEQYYCDTPTTLHTHDSIDEMRECIVEQGYASA